MILIQDGDSAGIDDLAVNRVMGLDWSGKDDMVQGASAPTVLSAMIDVSVLEYKNCVGQSEQFVDNCRPWNEAQKSKLHSFLKTSVLVTDVFSCVIFLDWLYLLTSFMNFTNKESVGTYQTP